MKSLTSLPGQIAVNIDRLLNVCSPTNAPLLRRYTREKERQGNTLSSRRNLLYNLLFLDKHHQGKSLLLLSPEEIGESVIAYAAGWGKTWGEPGRREGSSIKVFLTCTKAFYAWAQGGKIRDEFRAALTRRCAKPQEEVPIPEADFHKLLEAARTKTYHRRLPLNHALLWTYWDSGARVSEPLWSKLKHYHREVGGPAAKLEVNGKTGHRIIDLLEAVPALDAWIAVHPDRDNPEAPLFPNDRDPSRAMPPLSVNMTMRRLSVAAGVDHVHPHRFRHTRVSRASEANWSEPKMCRHFGWTNGSPMPSHYSHLRGESVAEQIRRDANVDPLGRLIQQDPHAAMAAVVGSTVDAVLRRYGLGPRPDASEGAAARVV